MAIILVVDDEIGIRELLSEILIDEGFDVRLAENAATARAIRQELRPDLVLLDIWMPDTDGISLLKEWKSAGLLNMPVVMMSGHGTIDTAVEATRFGACAFLEKPIALQKLLATVQKSLKNNRLFEKMPITLDDFSRIGPVKDFKKRLEQAASKSHLIFLKNTIAAIAEMCARSLQAPSAPFLNFQQLNTPLTLDKLENLKGGVLLVPDFFVLSKMQQMSLNFALERLDLMNLTLIIATHKIPENAGDPKESRVFRLMDVWLSPPLLATHLDDIPPMAEIWLNHFVRTNEVPPKHFSTSALNALRTLSWEAKATWNDLYSLVKNLALTALDEEITEEDVARLMPEPAEANPASPILQEIFERPLREARDIFERHYFEYHLKRENNNMTRLSECSGLERTHLYRKLKQLGISLKQNN